MQRDSLDSIKRLNQKRLTVTGAPEIATRINSCEMAYRMQTSAPELMDLSKESKATLEMYADGPQRRDEHRDNQVNVGRFLAVVPGIEPLLLFQALDSASAMLLGGSLAEAVQQPVFGYGADQMLALLEAARFADVIDGLRNRFNCNIFVIVMVEARGGDAAHPLADGPQDFISQLPHGGVVYLQLVDVDVAFHQDGLGEGRCWRTPSRDPHSRGGTVAPISKQRLTHPYPAAPSMLYSPP